MTEATPARFDLTLSMQGEIPTTRAECEASGWRTVITDDGRAWKPQGYDAAGNVTGWFVPVRPFPRCTPSGLISMGARLLTIHEHLEPTP